MAGCCQQMQVHAAHARLRSAQAPVEGLHRSCRQQQAAV